MGVARMIKAGTGNSACLLAFRNQTASWIQVFVDFTKE
jgi:hypothetical protein